MAEATMDDPFALLDGMPSSAVTLVVFAAALAEYLCPPLPADTFVLAGGLLIARGGASGWTLLVAAVTGSTIGAGAQWWLGRALGRSGVAAKLPRWLGVSSPENHARFARAFDRYGLWVIVVNRAFPGVRAVTFVAAGAARLPFQSAMAAGLVSNILWSALLLSIGMQVGADAKKILVTFFVYRRVLLAGVAGAVLLFVLVKLWQRHRRA
ncbi:MAG: DedA family protein [Myxococcota bacterium]